MGTPPIFLSGTPRHAAGHGRGGGCYKGLSFPVKESPCYTNLRYLFILLNSEKNEPRSAAAVIGPFGLSLRSPSGGCGTRSAQTVLALFPPSPLRLRRPIKAESGIVTVAVFFNPSVLRTPPLYFAMQNTPQCYGTRQGRRIIVFCISVFGVVQMSRREIR